MGGTRPTLYVNVPDQTVRSVLAKHVGMARGSGRLPSLVEVDEDGIQWAEAAVSPSDSDTGDSGFEASGEDDSRRSPYSAIHLGAPPPLPPPLPITTSTAAAATGEMTPPPQLIQMTMSPIATTHERFINEDFE